MEVRRRGYDPPKRVKPVIPKPESLTGLAADYWDRTVPELIDRGVAQTLDASALQAMCEWWGEYQKEKHTDCHQRKDKIENR